MDVSATTQPLARPMGSPLRIATSGDVLRIAIGCAILAACVHVAQVEFRYRQLAEAATAVNPNRKNLTRTGPIRSILDSTGHFVHFGDGREQLFDWRRDIEELEDLSAAAFSPPLLAGYRA